MEKIKVLLVDDDLLFGNIATKILKAADYEVCCSLRHTKAALLCATN